MTPGRPGTRLAAWSSGAVFLVSVTFLGLVLGGLIATRVLTTTAMGWDQIADALGGAFVGSVAALVIGVLLVRRISARRRLIGAGLAVVLAVACIVYLRSTPAKVAPPQQAAAPPVPSFTLHLATGDPLQGPRYDVPELPWNWLRISSNLSFDYKTLAPPEHCLAPGVLRSDDGIAALNRLRAILEALPDSIACEPCPTCVEVGLEWYLDQDRHTLAFSERCWRGHADLQPLRASIERIVSGHAEHVTCEPDNR